MKDKNNKLGKILLTILIIAIAALYNKYSYLFTDLVKENEVDIQYKDVSEDKTKIDTNKELADGVPKLEVTFLDVGQADSTLIQYQDSNILIDAGNNGDGKLLVDYFKSLGITTFQYVVGTHPHEDHIGGMDDIINNFDINHYLMPNVRTKLKTFTDVEKALEENNITPETPNIDEEFNVDDLKFKVISVNDNKDNINSTSIVLKLTYKNNSFLFTGDAEKDVELEIQDKDIKCDVLKVAHHGSKYSTSAQFLVKAHPTIAIISAGKDNKYNHPHQVTLDKLEYIKAKIYQTEKDHSIKVISDGDNLKVETLITNTNS